MVLEYTNLRRKTSSARVTNLGVKLVVLEYTNLRSKTSSARVY